MSAPVQGKKMFVLLSGLLLLLNCIGCSERLGQVSGKVRYAGQPVPGGTIVLRDHAGNLHHGQISPDGLFRLTDVALGEAQVGVSSLLERPTQKGQATSTLPSRVGEPAAVYSRIPLRYGDLGRSDLTVKVERDSTLDLDLE